MKNFFEIWGRPAIRGKKYNDGEFPTMVDGVRGMNFIEATVASHKEGNVWVDLENGPRKRIKGHGVHVRVF